MHRAHDLVRVAGEHRRAGTVPLAGHPGDREITALRVAEVPGLLRTAALRLPFVEAGRGEHDARAQQRARPRLGRAVRANVEGLAVLLEPPSHDAQLRLAATRRDDRNLGAG